MKTLLLFLFCCSFGFSQSSYWQQHVDYTMEIDVNVKDHTYNGEQKLVYTEAFQEYTKQFEGATLLEMTKLDRQIDGISGATLSHYALQKMAKLALYLDSYVKR